MDQLIKKCSKCLIDKSIDCFGHFSQKKSGKVYLQSWCKECDKLSKRAKYLCHPRILMTKEEKKERKREYEKKNRSKFNQIRRERYIFNQVECRQKRNLYRYKNKERCSFFNKEWKKNNSDKVKISNQSYIQKHKEQYRNYQRQWQRNNKDKLSRYAKQWREQNLHYSKNRSLVDIQYRLSAVLRSRLQKALKGNFKAGSAVRDLGCSIPELKLWLEQQFQPGMTWENYGSEWHIDHIIPLSKVDLIDRKQLLRVCHWFNLRPLWAEENLSRGNRCDVQ